MFFSLQNILPFPFLLAWYIDFEEQDYVNANEVRLNNLYMKVIVLKQKLKELDAFESTNRMLSAVTSKILEELNLCYEKIEIIKIKNIYFWFF